eukprot:m.477852 g.477852  ORF g.477852 m.477852 type:complete len:157 (+) comp45126_c0_seq1:73-543(+)
MDSPEQAHQMEKKIASELRKGDLLMIRDRACRITDTPNHFKNGKHGKAKVVGAAEDIFDSSKSNIKFEFSAKESLWAPVLTKSEYLVIGLGHDGNALGLMDTTTCATRHDMSLPDNELGEGVRELLGKNEQVIVTINSCIGRDLLVGFKKDTSDEQ